MADWASTHRLWEKWASNNIGSSGEPLKAALLLNYDPNGPSRLLSVIAEQEGTNLKAIDLHPFLDFVKRNNLQKEFFFIGSSQCFQIMFQLLVMNDHLHKKHKGSIFISEKVDRKILVLSMKFNWCSRVAIRVTFWKCG
uniref:Uncharacterized protein LOC105032222 isoform X2 n=1 Tax=Elaeis guineensis var. tenera TaxID=51953 RepID=A0A6I9Q8Y7_ELAGV|nr:uncharacterized protein LOC105032222 isoform X2 [Elaeis guineensis]